MSETVTLNLNAWRESRKPIEFTSSSGDTARIKSSVSFDGYKFLLSPHQEKIVEDKEFAIGLLNHFLIETKGKKLSEWGEDELLLLCQKWSTVTFSEVDNIEIDTFADFRKVTNAYTNTIHKNLLESVKIFQEVMQKSLSGYWTSENILGITKVVTAFSDELSEMLRSMTENLLLSAKTTLTALSSSGVFDNLESKIKYQENAIEAFKVAGWSIAPSMSDELIEKVVFYYHQNKSQYVSQVILGNYHRNNFENLKTTVNSWDSNVLFSPRMHILQSVLRAHCAGEYTLSVPVLYSQIEGIVNEYIKSNGLNTKLLGKPQKGSKAVVGNVDEYPILLSAMATTLLFQLENNIFNYENFEKEFNKSPNRRKITRHTVLHGFAINYDKPSVSLKAFILLDALSALQDAKNDK